MNVMMKFGAAGLLAFISGWASSGASEAKECVGTTDAPLVRLLPQPPCESCDETKAELSELLELQKSRSPEQSKHAGDDFERSVGRFLSGAGISFDAAKLAECEPLFLKWRKEGKEIVDAAKNAFCRDRPYTRSNSGLRPLKQALPDDSYSYPSGHSAYGATLGTLLSQMLPEKKSEIYGRINDYARSRMVAGVHYRSDVEAGKLIGAAIATELFARDQSAREFANAKACVRSATGFSNP